MEYLTVSDLRRITGKPVHVLNHAIDRYGPEPRGRIGIARVWSKDDVPRVQESLRKTQAVSLSRGARSPRPSD